MRICVFAGSSTGDDPAYENAAAALAVELAGRGVGIVYGGGKVGLMGTLADAALASGGEVVGVIPEALMRREVGHTGLTELHVVGSMHERKALMADLAEAFVALPGGFGTLDELIEMTTWNQLGIHAKPVGLLDVSGYWQPLLELVDHAVEQGFIAQASRDLLVPEADPAALLAAIGF